QLLGENYTRILVNLNLPKEGEETFAFIDTVHEICAKYYDTSYFVGDSTSSYDLAKAFSTDNIIVSVLSALFVIIVLFFTFKSAGLPILQIAVIQGSIWINFSFATLFNNPIYFLSYLIVSSIQMGANIDYAIVISSRYMESKKSMSIKKAMREALKFAFPTVLTSGSILAAAGFLIGKLSTNPAIVSIGKTLCSGTLTSMFLVMCVLPEILLLGDTIIEKTRFTIKTPEIVKKDTGRFIVNGRVRGYINGYVDADMHGVLKGDMAANVNMSNIIKEAEADSEKADK
ncbi:MAG: MMPL family transporter, partial [Clostridiales bacterium]|nr:MMPL family transporter [Clostridiales bacterium]